VRFCDISAVIPLLVEQAASGRVGGWLEQDGAVVLWTMTTVEVASALRRLVREHAIDETAATVAEDRLGDLARVSHVVVDVEPVKALARRLLRLHALRAFDALQLAAALRWAEGRPERRTLHTLDERLALAGRGEGFVVPA
jgi:predicted nucleic acid-binding protein